jgi:hypothetical protein
VVPEGAADLPIVPHSNAEADCSHRYNNRGSRDHTLNLLVHDVCLSLCAGGFRTRE